MVRRIGVIAVFILAVMMKEAQVLRLGAETEMRTLEAGEYDHFTVTLPAEVETSKNYLIFEANGKGEGVPDPDIFISPVNPKPTRESCEWKCASLGSEICVVPKSVVAGSKAFYASVTCSKKCQYTVIARLSEEYGLVEGVPVEDHLEAGESRMFRVHVRDDPAVHSLSVTLHFGGANSTQVRMFLSKAEQTPTTDNTLRVSPMISGFISRIYKSDGDMFCVNCSYLVLISSEVFLKYTLSFHTNLAVTQVRGSMLDVYDVVRFGERNCYQYKVKSATDSLEVIMNTFSGDPNIYVNPLTLPATKEGFKFSSTGSLDEQLSISPGQRQEAAAVTGAYFVCIYGVQSAAYGLIVRMESEQASEIPIHSGMTRTMQVQEGEMRLFSHAILQNTVKNITFFLVSLSGNADLYVKFCILDLAGKGADPASCTLTTQNMNDSNVFKSRQVSSIDRIMVKFNPPKEVAATKEFKALVGVYGVKQSRFSLIVLDQEQTQVPLAEGVPLPGYVGLYQFSYYLFTVDDPETAKVKVQLTPINGALTCTYRGSTHAAAALCTSATPPTTGPSPTSSSSTRTKMGASARVGNLKLYTIQYTTERPGVARKAVQLYDGIPQTGTMTEKEEDLLFVFSKPHEFTFNLTHIRIVFTPFAGSYRTLIGFNFVPSPTNFTYEIPKTESSLIIRTPLYFIKGLYYVRVIKKTKGDTAPHFFSLKYYTGRHRTEISEGVPEFGNLTSRSIAYYYFILDPTKTSATILVTPISGDPDLFVSIDSNNTLPTPHHADYFSAKIGADSIQIKTEDFLKLNPQCATPNSSSDCGVYIGVICATDECLFTLQLTSVSSVINLVDGMPQFGTLAQNQSQYFRFIPQVSSIMRVVVKQKRGRVKAYASLSSYNMRDQVGILPTPSSHHRASESEFNSEVLVVSPDEIKNCGRMCMAHIGVFDKTSSIPGALGSQYTITASSSPISRLIDSQPIVDTVHKDEFKYYQFRVGCRECVLSISLTPISDGDPDLYVNKGDQLPTTEQSHFSAATLRGEFLQIAPDDLFYAKHNASFKGLYTLGVHGFQNCTFSLMVTTSTSNIKQLDQGARVKQVQRALQTSYFSFSSWKRANIVVTAAMHYGRATIRANVVPDLREVNLLQSLPTSEANSTWSSTRANTLNSLTIRSFDKKFLENGVYFIAVETQENSEYEITIDYSSNEDYQMVKIGEPARVRVLPLVPFKLAFLVSSRSDIKIVLNVFNGEVKGSVSTEPEGDPIWTVHNHELLISSQDPHYRLGKFYVLLQGMTELDLTITVTLSAQMVHLSEGLPQHSEISASAPAYFLYSIPQGQFFQDQQLRVSVFVQFIDQVEDPVLYLKSVFKQQLMMPGQNQHDHKFVYDSDMKRLGGTIKLSDTQAHDVAIAVTDDFTQGIQGIKRKFNIAVWSRGIAVLIPGSVYEGKLEEEGGMDTYEVLIGKASKLYVEVVPCAGDVEFFIIKDLVNIYDKQHEIKETELRKGKIYGSVKAPVGRLYVTVRGIAAPSRGTLRTITYTIRAIVSDAESVDELEDLSLEEYGNIKFTLKGDRLTLHWGNVVKRAEGKSTPVDALYSVYMSEDPASNFESICGMKLGDPKIIATSIRERQLVYEIDSKRKDKKLAFNVIAYIPKHDQSVAYHAVYLHVPSSSGVPRFYIALSVLLFLAMAGAAIYYFRKYRTAQATLNYELCDARNMVRISSQLDVPSAKASQYTHLTAQAN